MDSLGVLLITANIGSVCDEPEEIEKNWVQEFYKTVQHHQSAFIALHMQEYGGKNYQENMGSTENFIRRLIHSEEMSQYDCVQAFIDKDFTKPESFTDRKLNNSDRLSESNTAGILTLLAPLQLQALRRTIHHQKTHNALMLDGARAQNSGSQS